MAKEISIEELYTKTLGTNWVPVKVEKIEDVFKGKDLDTALELKEEYCTPQNCHYNSGAIAMFSNMFKEYDVTFCEGLYGDCYINHCWNCATNKITGEKHYIDFTLGEGEAILLNEWETDDIVNLFDSCENAFIPHRDMVYWRYKNDTTKEIFSKYFR